MNQISYYDYAWARGVYNDAQNRLPEAHPLENFVYPNNYSGQRYERQRGHYMDGVMMGCCLSDVCGGRGGNTTVINNYNGPTDVNRREENENRDNACLLIVIGSVVAAVASFFVGKLYSERNEISANVDEARDQVTHAQRATDFYDFAKAEMDIQDRHWSKLNAYLGSTIGALAGAVALVVAAIFAISPLAPIGGGILLLAGVVFLVTLGMHWNDAALDKKSDAVILENFDKLEPAYRPV